MGVKGLIKKDGQRNSDWDHGVWRGWEAAHLAHNQSYPQTTPNHRKSVPERTYLFWRTFCKKCPWIQLHSQPCNRPTVLQSIASERPEGVSLEQSVSDHSRTQFPLRSDLNLNDFFLLCYLWKVWGMYPFHSHYFQERRLNNWVRDE